MAQEPPQRDEQRPSEPSPEGGRKPPRSLEIPEILREPVDHPSLRPKAPSATMSAVGEIGKAMAIALDPLFVCAAGALLGWLIDNWLGSGPAGLLVGLSTGLVVGTWRLLVRLGQQDAPPARRGPGGQGGPKR